MQQNIDDYNTNFILKRVGYFDNYIYNYKDYMINKKILNPTLINNQIGIIYVIYKDKTGNTYTVYSQYPNGSTSVYDLLGNNVDWNENW